jgi:hypothetical protein
MKKLVLLQSPAHAASEIKRVLKAVRGDMMPLDDYGIEKALDPILKKALLEKGGEFDHLVDQARAWELGRRQIAAQADAPLPLPAALPSPLRAPALVTPAVVPTDTPATSAAQPPATGAGRADMATRK